VAQVHQRLQRELFWEASAAVELNAISLSAPKARQEAITVEEKSDLGDVQHQAAAWMVAMSSDWNKLVTPQSMRTQSFHSQSSQLHTPTPSHPPFYDVHAYDQDMENDPLLRHVEE
jgi:hypothetical protein